MPRRMILAAVGVCVVAAIVTIGLVVNRTTDMGRAKAACAAAEMQTLGSGPFASESFFDWSGEGSTRFGWGLSATVIAVRRSGARVETGFVCLAHKERSGRFHAEIVRY